MRVAIVSGYDWAVPGGVQGQVAAIAAGLARRHHEVFVVTPQQRPEAGPKAAGFSIRRAGRGINVPVNGSVAPVAPTPRACGAALKALWQLRPDVVHVHEPLVPGPPLAAVLAGPAPLVVTFHRADADVFYKLEGRLLGRAVSRRAAVATAVSAPAVATAREVLGSRLDEVVEVPNGVDVARFEHARAEHARAEHARAEHARAEGDDPAAGPGGDPSRAWEDGRGPVVGFVGRHEPRKGASVLVEAAARMDPAVRVVVAGEGPESAELRRRARGGGAGAQVLFPGRLEDDDVARLMAAADLFVAPALGGESFGVVLLEAMAAGTAVVCSDLPGYRAAAAGAARLFAAGDATGLAAAVADLLARPAERAELVELGLSRARACAIDETVERYLSLYATVTSAL